MQGDFNVGKILNCRCEAVIVVMFMANRWSSLFTAFQNTETDPSIRFPVPL